MKINNLKGYVIGSLIGSSLMFSAQSFAISDKIEAVYANFNFIVNGQSVSLDETPIVVKGKSYLPVKTIADKLGYNVDYKADSRTIEFVQSPQITPTPSHDPSIEYGKDVTSLGTFEYEILRDYIHIDGEEISAIKYDGDIYITLGAILAKYGLSSTDSVYNTDNKTYTFANTNHPMKVGTLSDKNNEVKWFHINVTDKIEPAFFKESVIQEIVSNLK